MASGPAEETVGADNNPAPVGDSATTPHAPTPNQHEELGATLGAMGSA